MRSSDKWMKVFEITDYDKRVRVPDFINRADLILNEQETEKVNVVNVFLELWFRA